MSYRECLIVLGICQFMQTLGRISPAKPSLSLSQNILKIDIEFYILS